MAKKRFWFLYGGVVLLWMVLQIVPIIACVSHKPYHFKLKIHTLDVCDYTTS